MFSWKRPYPVELTFALTVVSLKRPSSRIFGQANTDREIDGFEKIEPITNDPNTIPPVLVEAEGTGSKSVAWASRPAGERRAMALKIEDYRR
jgi:hypothetical protein